MKSHFGWIAIALGLLLAGCGGGSSTSQPGKSQTVGTNDSNVVSSIDAMGVGDLYYVNFSTAGTSSLNFSGASSTAKYYLIVQSTTSTGSNITASSASLSADPSQTLDDRLRDAEFSLSESGKDPAYNDSPAFSATKSLGEERSFRVLSSLSSSTSYQTVTATSRCVKDHIEVFVDSVLTDRNLTAADISDLCDKFEYSASQVESALGAPSDINSDGTVSILITHAINELGASGGGIITGYFYASDLYSRSSGNPTSNEREIIYILAPDPDGVYGITLSKEFTMDNLMTAVVPHELQHAISYNQHVLVNGGSSEKSWLNEALSHFSEDLVGFGQENPSRAEIFLSQPEVYPIAPSSSPDLGERGAEYLFMRYMYERSADPARFLSDLLNTSLTGQDNIEAAFAGTDYGFDEWEEFIRRWAVAVALTNTGISATAEYQFNDRTYNSTTGHWNGACLICDTDDGRGTALTGPYFNTINSSSQTIYLYGTAAGFYSITNAPSSVSLTGSSAASLQGVLIRVE